MPIHPKAHRLKPDGRKKVVTGSFNFTDAAQKRNTENVVFISDAKLAQEYSENGGNRVQPSTLYANNGAKLKIG